MDDRAKKTAGKLQTLGKRLLTDVNQKRNPALQIPLRSLANVAFNEKKKIIELGDQKQSRLLFNVGMARKFMQTFLVAGACRELLEGGKTTSIRDLYYITKHTLGDTRQNTFEEQEESDPIIEDLEVTIDSLREELNLFASNKGAMVGPLTIIDAGDTIDLRRMGSGGWSVPSIVEENVIQLKKSEVQFVLLVEKDAVWRRLNEDKFWQQHRCVIVHGGGQPPRGVRRLLRRLTTELKVPLYVLVDNDPWGFYIYSVVKQGSINLAFESERMAIPKAKFIGLSSADPDRYGLPRNVGIKLNDKDIGRAKELVKYRWFEKKPWQEEIKRMLASGLKYELDALANKDFRYLTKTYLPRTLKEEDWLD